MAAPGSDGTARDLAARLVLAAAGAAALAGEQAQALADALVGRGGGRSDEARALVDELRSRSRGEGGRLTERAAVTLAAAFRDLGLVTRDEFEELDLRVAQLEHRLRLLEGTPPPLPPARGIQV